MRAAWAVALFVAAASPGAPAARAKKQNRAATTVGLGRSCKARKDCHHKSQVCLHESDANGKEVPLGFCALPCLSFEAGTTKVVPGQPIDARLSAKDKKTPPRCPPRYQCRSAGNGVPIDMCVQE